MSCLSWNCSRLENIKAIQNLQQLTRERWSNFIFSVETLCLSSKINEIKTILNYDGFFSVDCIGHSGGLALLWKGVGSIALLDSSLRFIDVEVRLRGMDPWRFTGFYGEPDCNQRYLSWDTLKQLTLCSNLPWVCMVDFNDVLGMHEKVGGILQYNFLIQGFRDAVSATGLLDLYCDGFKFTWDNRQEGTEHVEAKLDRCMVSCSWKQCYNQAIATVLDISTLDHLPIFLQLRIFVLKSHVYLFRYKNNWNKKSAGMILLVMILFLS